jgi:O-antigen/teichoic acid export membrane protein
VLKRHTFIYLLAHGIPAAISLVALLAYTHLVNPYEYGTYVIGSTIGTFVSLVAFFWIRYSVTRYQSETEIADVRVTALVAYAWASVLLTFGLTISILIFGTRFNVSLAIIVVFFALVWGAFEISQEFRRAKLEPSQFLTVSVARSLMGFIFGLIAIIAGFGGYGLFLAIAVSYLVGALINIRSIWTPPVARFDEKLLARFFRYGAPFTVAALLFGLCSSFDRLLVAYVLDQSAAGRYGVAGDLARQSIGVVSMGVASAVFPIAFRSLGTAGPVAAYAHLRESAELFAAVVAPVAMLMALSANAFATAAVGAQYAETVSLLVPILSLARFFGAVSNFYVHISFQLSHKPILQIANGLVLFCVSLILIVLLTRSYGLIGAASASLIAETIGLISGIWLTRYGFRLPWAPRAMARIIPCLLVMVGAALMVYNADIGKGLFRLFAVLAASSMAYMLSAVLLDVAGIRAYILRSLPVTRLYGGPN